MKTLLKISKTLLVNALIFSLMQNSFIDQALAAEKKNNGGWEAKDILSIANGALGIYGSYLGQKQNMMQQMIASQTNQKLMAQMSPSCRKPDGTACYAVSGKYFPECMLPASMSNMPKNVCSSSTTNPGQIGQMLTYEAIANGWSNYYEQMGNRASNASYPTGLRCLEDKQKALDSQLVEMMNSLQRLQDRLNQDKQVFRDNNKKLLEEMNTANDELFGASKNNLATKTRDFAKYFSQSCQTVIGKERLNSGTAGGLNGILQGLSSENKAAADFSLNRAVIEQDIRREAEKIASSINGSGVDDWLNTKAGADSKSNKFPAVEDAVKKQAAEFATARARLNKELSSLGYTPPPMDKNFTADMDEFMAQAGDFFKKKYINECVTMADKGVALPVEDILKNLEQKSTRSGGTVTMDYRAALKKILESDAMMDAKMQMIKDLETQYPGITITYKNASQSNVTESPYNLFARTVEKCEQKYVQDDRFTSKGSSTGISYQKKVDRGRAALTELKTLNDTFASKITQSITNQVLNCNGEESKSGSACSEETMKTTSENFCVNHASKCANDIQGCYAEANKHVQDRKTKMENLAKKFNANVEAMVAKANALYEQQKAAVNNMTKLIQSKFPGTNFELPKDMFVAMPELKKDAFGVEMAADGNLSSILDGEGSMPAKIDKLKQMFKLQRDAVNKEISSYISLQEGAMKDNRSKWESLASECKGAVDASNKQLAHMNEEGMKKQAEQDQKVAKFCKKYNSISQNPVGGCNKAKDLAELSDSITARLAPQATSLTEQFASACDGFNNESSDVPDSCDDLKGSDLAVCRKKQKAYNPSGNKTKASKIELGSLCGSKLNTKNDSEFIANIAKKLSKDDQEKLKDVTTWNDALKKAESLEDNNFFNNISNLLQNSEKVCDQLLSINTGSDLSDELDSQEKMIKSYTEEKNKKETTEESKKLFEGIVRDAENKKKELLAQKEKENENKKKLQTYMSELASATVTDPKEGQLSLISKIGQQMEGPCDMQNNSSVAKGFDMNNFLMNYDKGVLGSSR